MPKKSLDYQWEIILLRCLIAFSSILLDWEGLENPLF